MNIIIGDQEFPVSPVFLQSLIQSLLITQDIPTIQRNALTTVLIPMIVHKCAEQGIPLPERKRHQACQERLSELMQAIVGHWTTTKRIELIVADNQIVGAIVDDQQALPTDKKHINASTVEPGDCTRNPE